MSRIVNYNWEERPREWENNISTALEAMSLHKYSNPKANPQEIESNDVTDEDDNDDDDDDDDNQRDEGDVQHGVLWEDRERSGVEMENHFSHPHPLYRFHLEAIDNTYCKICDKLILGFAHGCEPCDFFVDDDECLQFKSSKIYHLSHTHPLHLHPPSRYNTCDACLSPFQANTPFYRCDICDYDLHKRCAELREFGHNKENNHLKLYYSFPARASGWCSKCKVRIFKRGWVWHDRYTGYTAHLNCAVPNQLQMSASYFFRFIMRKFLVRRKSNRHVPSRRN